MILILFWSVPALLPGLSMLFWTSRDRVPVEPGHAWIALPSGMAENADPLEGWLLWPSKDLLPDPSPPPVRAPTTEAPELPVDSPPDIILSGRVTSGTAQVYCFLDTNAGRWFHLAMGDVDPVSGYRLRPGPGQGVALVDTDGNVLFSAGQIEGTLSGVAQEGMARP